MIKTHKLHQSQSFLIETLLHEEEQPCRFEHILKLNGFKTSTFTFQQRNNISNYLTHSIHIKNDSY